MTPERLEELMSKTFGNDFRDKAITTPVGSFSLADAFEECGMRDPKAVDAPLGLGLPQWVPARLRGLS